MTTIIPSTSNQLSVWQAHLMSIEDLLHWLQEQHLPASAEIGKKGYAYADPVAKAHDQRDQCISWNWTFDNLYAYLFVNGEQFEFELTEQYQTLYNLLPTAPDEDFTVPLTVSEFESALLQTQAIFSPKKEG